MADSAAFRSSQFRRPGLAVSCRIQTVYGEVNVNGCKL